MMRKTVLSLCLIFMSFWALAQCVSSFPHREDFENASLYQTSSSCDATIVGDTMVTWTQDTADDGDWRADTAGTPSIGTGPGCTFGTSGDGIGKDYNPGTTSGTYFYTEASSATGCTDAQINLISPCFDFSGSAVYRLKFAYHMYGSAMGVLHVDVWDSNVWVNDVYEIYNENELDWQVAEVPLFQYNKSETRIRIRMSIGDGFTSDCAIDDLVVEEYTPVDYDVEIYRTRIRLNEYYFFPLNHADSIEVLTYARNIGTKSLTDARAVATINSWSDSSSSYTIDPMDNQLLLVSQKFLPTTQADTQIQVDVKVKETEASVANNSATLPILLTDSTYGRDDGTFTGSVGFNTGTGEIGTMLELKEDDTLTSVSFLIVNPIAGDSLKVHLYEFGTAPGTLLTSTESIATGNVTQWYTIKFKCPQVLKKGKYFVSVEQLTANSNMGLAYNSAIYRTGVSYFGGAGTWTELGSGGINGITSIHMNFGIPSLPKASITALDSVCNRQSVSVRGKGGIQATWGPDGFFGNKNSFVTTTRILTQDTTIYLAIEDKCGFKDTAWHHITANPLPTAKVSADTTVCKYDPALLSVKTDASNSYTWNTGTANSSTTYSGTEDKEFTVKVDSSNGCSSSYSVYVSVSKPDLVVTKDTTVCERNLLTLQASGAPNFQWLKGPSSDKFNVYPDQNTSYSVVGSLANGCTDTATINVTVTPGPDLKITPDTGVCFGDNVTLSASGADSYEWVNGPQTKDWTFRPLSTKKYMVTGRISNGCSLQDTVEVTVANTPSLDVSKDTTICEGGSASLTATASSDAAVKWSTGENTKGIVVSPTSKTTYYVEAKNAVGCAANDSILVEVNPLPIVNVSHTLKDKNLLGVSNSEFVETHLWEFGDGKSSASKNPSHTYSEDGTYTVKYTATNRCGSKDTSFTITIKTASVANFAAGSIAVYPNPSSTGWMLAFEQENAAEFVYSVYDSHGKKVLSSVQRGTQGEKYIDGQTWSPGVYVLVLQVNGRMYQQKLVKH